jgi:hypothetical protein
MALGLQAAPSIAQPALKVALHYETDGQLEGCPSPEQFQASVRDQLGYDPFDEQAPMRVTASASAAPHGIVGELLWHDADGALRGERRLSADHRDCTQFARNLAFAVLVQLQLLAKAAEDAAPDSAEPTTTPPKDPKPASAGQSVTDDGAPPTKSTRDNKSTPDRPSTGALNAGLGPSVAVGLAPAPSLLGRVFATARHGMLSMELGASGSWPTTHRTQGEAGFRSSALFATLAPCAHLQGFAACGLVHAGQLTVRGTGIDEPRSSSGVLAQAGVRAAFAQPLGPLAASLHVDLLRAFERWAVLIDGAEHWTQPGFTLVVGADFAFGSVLSW